MLDVRGIRRVVSVLTGAAPDKLLGFVAVRNARSGLRRGRKYSSCENLLPGPKNYPSTAGNAVETVPLGRKTQNHAIIRGRKYLDSSCPWTSDHWVTTNKYPIPVRRTINVQ